MIKHLALEHSVVSNYLMEMRNISIQGDRMRFRRNLERIGEVMAYEISKTLAFSQQEIQTPLAKVQVPVLSQQPIITSIFRAALPMYQGFLNYFDQADNAFVSAYRKHEGDGSFSIALQYAAFPSLDNRVLIVIDPMLATGASMAATVHELLKFGTPSRIILASAIASQDGVDYVQKHLPQADLYVAAIDPILNSDKYIVPGLGDAGDLAFGEKMQH